MLRIDNLANHLHLLPQLAAWHSAEWRHSVPDTPDRQALLRSRTSSGSDLPQTFVALVDGDPAGFVSLLDKALPDDAPAELHKLTPWLAGLLVDPQRRRQSIGNALVRHACRFALAAGHHAVHLFTATPGYYTPAGWHPVEHLDVHDIPHTVMSYEFTSAVVNS